MPKLVDKITMRFQCLERRHVPKIAWKSGQTQNGWQGTHLNRADSAATAAYRVSVEMAVALIIRAPAAQPRLCRHPRWGSLATGRRRCRVRTLTHSSILRMLLKFGRAGPNYPYLASMFQMRRKTTPHFGSTGPTDISRRMVAPARCCWTSYCRKILRPRWAMPGHDL